MTLEAKIILNFEDPRSEILMKKRFIDRLEKNSWIKTQHSTHEIILSKEVDIAEFENEKLLETPVRRYFKKILRTHYSAELTYQIFEQSISANTTSVDFGFCTCEVHISA